MTLKEYLSKIGMTALDFSIKAKLSPATIYKLYHGGKLRKDTAKRIVRATRGIITLEDLGHGKTQTVA